MADKKFANDDGCFMSTNCVDVYVDGPVDLTIRPIQGERLHHLKQIQERIKAAVAAGVDLSVEQIVNLDEENKLCS